MSSLAASVPSSPAKEVCLEEVINESSPDTVSTSNAEEAKPMTEQVKQATEGISESSNNDIPTNTTKPTSSSSSSSSPEDNSKLSPSSLPKITTKEKEEQQEIDQTLNNIPQPIQIVKVGDASDSYSFTLNEEALTKILQKAGKDIPVSVVSVVGAFRTGKSFLLSWFLRYLNETSLKAETNVGDNGEGSQSNSRSSTPGINEDGFIEISDSETTTKSFEEPKPSKRDESLPWYKRNGEKLTEGEHFDWRGGSDRHTTGIWMWSEPFQRLDKNGNKVTLLLVDTQGMFDHETTMGLTAAIFGLITLLSSFQIYNVSGRIQEDNLQQLALFSEYGKMALLSDNEAEAGNGEGDDVPAIVEDGGNGEDGESRTVKKITKKEVSVPTKKCTPFQNLDFLVRDWPNFDDEDAPMETLQKEMETYFSSVIATREAKDLKDTREQISECFEKIDCFLMTHPGHAVTKKTYDGSIEKINDSFLSLLTVYCEKVFTTSLKPKKIHGHELTPVELGEYIKSYASLFKSGAHFPEATTMLAATSEANNRNALQLSIDTYRKAMDRISGPKCSQYLSGEEFDKSHAECVAEAYKFFDNMATFGATSSITSTKLELEVQVENSRELYKSLNESRNPLSGLETYALPLSIAAISYVLRFITELTCTSWSSTCRAGSTALTQVYQVVILFLLIIAATKGKQILSYMKQIQAALQVVNGKKND